MRWLKRLQSQSSTALQHGEEIDLENFDIPVKFRRHPKARRLTLRVSTTNRSAIITAPPFCSDHETLKFLESNKSWLYKQFEKIPHAIPFASNHTIPLRGIPHKINFAGPVRGKGVVWIEEGLKDTSHSAHNEHEGVLTRSTQNEDHCSVIQVSGNPQFAPRRLRSWLINQARKDLYKYSLWHANNLDVKFKKIMIKDQQSRWGSCSTKGILSYSWRLILSPPEVLEYVAAHEVAHLLEMNHGPNFWALVHQTMPNYETPKKWLRDHGTNLHRYGAQD